MIRKSTVYTVSNFFLKKEVSVIINYLSIGNRAGRVRVIFELPDNMQDLYKGKLAYVEMFNEMSKRPDAKTGLFTVTRSIDGEGARLCDVVALSDIRMTCHLAPKYDTTLVGDRLLHHSDALQIYKTFYFNIYASYLIFELLRH